MSSILFVDKVNRPRAMAYVMALNLVERTTFGQDEKRKEAGMERASMKVKVGSTKNLSPSSASLDASGKNGTWVVLTNCPCKELWTAL